MAEAPAGQGELPLCVSGRPYLLLMVQGKSRRRGMKRRARECAGKEPLPQDAAVTRAIRLTKTQGVKIRAYKCSFCYLPNGSCAWHVGHAQPLTRRLGA